MQNSSAARSVSTLVVSVLLHAGAGVLVIALASRARPEPEVQRARPDFWAGNTLDVDALVEPGVPQSGGARRAPARPLPLSRHPSPTSPRAVHDKQSPRSHRVRAPRLDRSAAAEPPSRARTRPKSSRALSSKAAARVEAPTGAAFGAQGGPNALRDLGKAFTRALPRAASGDRLWSELPLGPAGSAHVVVRIDGGRIVDAKPKEKVVPAQITHLLERTVILLRAGQFALSESDATSGSEVLYIEFTIRSGSPSDDLEADPTDTVALGFRAPRPGKPGRAYFTLASGRRIEARVTLSRGGPSIQE